MDDRRLGFRFVDNVIAVALGEASLAQENHMVEGIRRKFSEIGDAERNAFEQHVGKFSGESRTARLQELAYAISTSAYYRLHDSPRVMHITEAVRTLAASAEDSVDDMLDTLNDRFAADLPLALAGFLRDRTEVPDRVNQAFVNLARGGRSIPRAEVDAVYREIATAVSGARKGDGVTDELIDAFGGLVGRMRTDRGTVTARDSLTSLAVESVLMTPALAEQLSDVQLEQLREPVVELPGSHPSLA